MLKEALNKLQREIAANPQSEYTRFVGSEMIKFVRENPDKAELFADPNKSLSEGLVAMRYLAMRKRNGSSVSVLTMEEGLGAVLKYYGIKQPKAAPEPVVVGFSVDLDDL
ncbi:hypothetical protein PA598K_01365 [Paenibacillus sp. 598K]|uniref:hypothetical protein n=1 Tax=Paenibacillus sp. 598K TaxID=1117987 RepID=UPI000FF9BB1E|nr:hypothetical protein [Paenibacillus sp. 598K]GBF73080.1 hypothetical protein PA598K_01365 [Paenibacillus sp. 598K]